MAFYISYTKIVLVSLYCLLNAYNPVLGQVGNAINCDSVYYKPTPPDSIFTDYLFADGFEPVDVIKWGELRLSEKQDSILELEREVKILVEFVVDKNGEAFCPKVVRSENDQFNHSAIDLVLNSKFQPAKKDGKNIISTATYPVWFKLRNRRASSIKK